jgi:hypothetical protein
MELTLLRSKTRRALKTWMSTKHPIDKVLYSSLKRENQLAVRSAKSNSWKLFIQETLNKDLHSALKEISSKEDPSSQSLELELNICSYPAEILSKFADQIF